jgi:hypothetical protein
MFSWIIEGGMAHIYKKVRGEQLYRLESYDRGFSFDRRGVSLANWQREGS